MSLDVTLHAPVCSCCGHRPEPFFDANITHNLGAMADEGGFYQPIWRPEECDITTAFQLIEPLSKAIELMLSEPARFKRHDAANGWGTYEQFLGWLEKYYAACVENPEARVEVSR